MKNKYEITYKLFSEIDRVICKGFNSDEALESFFEEFLDGEDYLDVEIVDVILIG